MAPPSAPGERFFLVDPLDGTREFIAGENEYTVNVALIVDGQPIAGHHRGTGIANRVARHRRPRRGAVHAVTRRGSDPCHRTHADPHPPEAARPGWWQ